MTFCRVHVNRNYPMAGSFPLCSVISAPSPGKNHITAANGLGVRTHLADTQVKSSGLLPCSPADILFPDLLKSQVPRPFSHSLFLPIVYIFLFVDNNPNVPGSCFECLCSTWDHFNTFADGLEHFFSLKNEPWTLNHLAIFLYWYINTFEMTVVIFPPNNHVVN